MRAKLTLHSRSSALCMHTQRHDGRPARECRVLGKFDLSGLPFPALVQGLSGRPAFTASDRASAEDFFLESLNTWRTKQGLGKFILVGHSLGACGVCVVCQTRCACRDHQSLPGTTPKQIASKLAVYAGLCNASWQPQCVSLCPHIFLD